MCVYVCYNIQWNPSNLDTIGPEESVLIREVSIFQGLKSTQTWHLERKKVSCLEGCLIRRIIIEGFQLLFSGIAGWSGHFMILIFWL